MGGGAEQGAERGKIVGRRGFAFANLLDRPLWKEVLSFILTNKCIAVAKWNHHLFQVLLDTSSIVGSILCIKGDASENLIGRSSQKKSFSGVGDLSKPGGWPALWCQLVADQDPHTVYVGQDHDDGDPTRDDKCL